MPQTYDKYVTDNGGTFFFAKDTAPLQAVQEVARKLKDIGIEPFGHSVRKVSK